MGRRMRPTHVLDTCAFLDLARERWTSKPVIREFLDSAAPVVLSVSVWEIARKAALGKLDLPCAREEILVFCREVCTKFLLTIDPVTAETCHFAECLPLHHRDPFDRMILAHAERAGCPVITSDRQFDLYDVQVRWHRG